MKTADVIYHERYRSVSFLDIFISSRYPYAFGNRRRWDEGYTMTSETCMESEDENFTHRHVKRKGHL
jgi:hypothetical protein